MIVYCGNDYQDNDETDSHAKRIKELLHICDPKLNIIICTNNDSKLAHDAIKNFTDGIGDVLIVKMMGSVGLDIPRLKVECDLSSVRTASTFVQKVNRAPRTIKKYNMEIMLPRRIKLLESLWDRFIADEGGEYVVSEEKLLDEYDREKEEKKKEQCNTSNAKYIGSTDTDKKNTDDRDYDEFINPLVEWRPALTDTLSYSDIAELGRLVGPKITRTKETIKKFRRYFSPS